MTVRADANASAWSRRAHVAALAALVVLACGAAGCSMAHLTNAAAPPCQTSLRSGLESILTAEDEKPEVAVELASASARSFARVDPGPRPFAVASPSGTDYGFFFDGKGDECLLRLYGWQKGFVKYTNDLTYIETRPLAGCTCEE